MNIPSLKNSVFMGYFLWLADEKCTYDTFDDDQPQWKKYYTHPPRPFSTSQGIPKGMNSTMKGIRNIVWRSDKPATLTYVIALDEDDQANDVKYRDEVLELPAPFTGGPRSLIKTLNR